MAEYTEKEVLDKIRELCRRYGITISKDHTGRNEEMIRLYRRDVELAGPKITYSLRGKNIHPGIIDDMSRFLATYLVKFNPSLDSENIKRLLKTTGKKESKRALETIVEQAAGALVVLAIIFMGLSRNITSFAIYEKEKFNTPIVFLLVSLGILLILLYYLSRKV